MKRLTELELEFDGRLSTVVLARDITERKEQQARLLLRDRLASLGTLALRGWGHRARRAGPGRG